MARGRMIDKRISMSKKLGNISDQAKVIYFMIYPHLDQEGRIAFDDLEDLKVEIIPYFMNWNLSKIRITLNELADIKLIVLYPDRNKIAIEFKRFKDFQQGIRKDREALSKIKKAPNSGGLRINPALRLNRSLSLKVKINEGMNEKKRYTSSTTKKNDIIFKWNALAQEFNLAAIENINSGSMREKYLRARSAEKNFNFDLLIDMIRNSPFLLGKTKDPFFVFFDWILKPTNYQKIMEGNYLDRRSLQRFSGIIEAMAELKKRHKEENKNGP